jgi:hypothetical protein
MSVLGTSGNTDSSVGKSVVDGAITVSEETGADGGFSQFRINGTPIMVPQTKTTITKVPIRATSIPVLIFGFAETEDNTALTFSLA